MPTFKIIEKNIIKHIPKTGKKTKKPRTGKKTKKPKTGKKP